MRTRGFAYGAGLCSNSNSTANFKINNLNHALIKNEQVWSRGLGKVIELHGTQQDHAVSHSKTSEGHLEFVWMGHPSTPTVLPRPGAILLSSTCNKGASARKQHFNGFQEVKERFDEWFALKSKVFLSC